MVRTALFNWAFARHTGGTFVFRIEDTDSSRDTDESYDALVSALTWLGLDWDEGPQVGGPYGPYRQSERLPIYADVAERLLQAGYAFRCYCTAEELEQRRAAAREAGRPPGYEGTCRDLDDAQRSQYENAGRESVVRFRMPDRDFVWEDLVRGEIRFPAGQVPDYVIVRANGEPLYTLVNPVDDALMHITHVLRGEDLLSSTPRQIVMHEALAALGVGDGTMPMFGHLPYVMGEGNRKLSKRDPQSALQMYRDEGYLPEALLNYLALLGWSIGGDREFFTLTEMAEKFTLDRVNPNPARFDLKKCTAINGDWIRSLDDADVITRIIPYLQAVDLVSTPPTAESMDVLSAAVPLIKERIDVLSQAGPMLDFLLQERIAIIDTQLIEDSQAQQVLNVALEALQSLPDWTASNIEAALRSALIDGLELKPKLAFGPVRVAVTGRKVSPPLFESMEILGRERSLERIGTACAQG
jgi:glutamyl-tRNA synthetase